MSTPEDPLAIDVRRDLERVDGAMTGILQSPEAMDEFARDPNGVLVRFGLHPQTTPEINERVNGIFYAALTNKELIDFVLEHFSTFEMPEGLRTENEKMLNDSLERGEIEQSVELDMLAADHFFRQPEVLKRAYQLTLHDLNERGLLAERHEPGEIDEYIDGMVATLSERRSIAEISELERWDENYGVGTGYGAGEVEVGPVATVAVPVEVFALFTTIIPVAVAGDSAEQVVLARAARGDEGAIRKLAAAGALFRLAGDVMTNAQRFRG